MWLIFAVASKMLVTLKKMKVLQDRVRLRTTARLYLEKKRSSDVLIWLFIKL